MKLTDQSIAANPPVLAVASESSAGRPRFVSLRLKFVIFFSLILTATSSALSWYFIETKRAALTDNLYRVGTILLKSHVNNGRFRFAGVIAGDRSTLQQFTDSLMAVDEVMYVVVRGTDQLIVAQQNKLVRESSGSPIFTQERRFYPDEAIALAIYRNPPTGPLVTPVALSEEKILMPTQASTDWLWLLSPTAANLYDFAMPILVRPDTDPARDHLPTELQEGSGKNTHGVQGVLQIGLSDALVKRELVTIIQHVFLLTILIIGAGILGAHFLTLRITTPLRALAGVARQLTEGRRPEPLTSTTHDEVGELTATFNAMARSLQERNAAITAHMNTIQRQVTQLSTLHQASAAIASRLDLQELLDTVLQLLMTNLGFSRMMLMLRHEDRDIAYVAQIAGVSSDIADSARQLTIPITDDHTVLSELLLHARPVLVDDIEKVAHRMHPVVLALARRVGVTSFACVPLQSKNQTVGFLGGDRGAAGCTDDDLHILLTIAGHVATAIDNARAYAHLAQMTHQLEYRIQERTQELVAANERLRDHDRRRSLFFSVASHELRTPMTAIRSFADNMSDGVAGPLTERQRTYLARIGHNMDRLTRIINQLLDWSRLDLQKVTLRLEPLCVGDIAALVADNLRPLAREKQVTISVLTSDHLPIVQADRDKLEQIFWNLIGNAIRFTPPQGTISVSLVRTATGEVQATVADTGCGIALDYLDKVFDEFSKVPSPQPAAQGAQLGLFITKSLVTMHHGTITVDSAVGRGTTFTLTFPPAPAQTAGTTGGRGDTGNA